MRGTRLLAILPLLALLAFAAGQALVPMAESDLFFRLAAGREILAHHAIPTRNLFSFTAPDFPDLDASWLFEVAAALIFRAAGFPGVVVAKTLVVLAIATAAFALCRRRGAGPVAAALAVATALAVMQERLVERPHIFSFVGEIGVLFALEELAGRAATASATAIDHHRLARVGATLLAGVVLWANLHAGVFIAPVLLSLFAAGALIDRRSDQTALEAAPQVAPLVLAVTSVAAMVATPLGFGIFRYLALHLSIPRLHAVDEFRAATWQSDGALALYAAAAVAAAFVAWRRGAGLRRLLPVAGLGVLTAHTVRFGADFALCAAPLLAVAASAGAQRLSARLGGRWPAAWRGGATPVVLGASALLVGLAWGPRLSVARSGRPVGAAFVDVPVRLDLDVGLDQTPLPLDAIQFVEENGLRQRMYNDFEIGSYLAFQGYPRYRVFIDPRLPAYPAAFHRLLGRADLGRDEWDQAMQRYGVDSALLAYAGLNRRVSWWDPARWALVYRQHDARVFVRRLPKWRALIAAREIPATFSFTVEEGTATLPLDDPPPGSPVVPCEWQRRLGDLLVELDAGQPARALVAYRRALSARPGCLAPADEAALRRWVPSAPPSK